LTKANFKLDSLLNNQNDYLNKLAYEKKNVDSLLKKQNVLKDSLQYMSKKLNTESLDTLNFVSSTGNTVKYYGKVSKGKANGKGVGFWSTGGYYYGEWKSNFRHGKGLYLWKNGDKYYGDFFDDKREGEGSYQWYQGERYEGTWSNNQRSGVGTLYNSDGSVKFSGKWSEDKPVE
jgi:hypothetical protein